MIALAVFVPVSDAAAAPEVIDDASVALRKAERIANATPTAPSTPAPSPAPTPTSPTPTGDVSGEIEQVLVLVNAERTSRGRGALQLSTQLNDAALAHTKRQAADGEIYHDDPQDGSGPGERVSRTGYRWSAVGENVAAGYSTPAAVMTGWMDSPGHRANILNPDFTELGVGYVPGGTGYSGFWTQVFARPA